MSDKIIITIGRQYGSGGGEIGKKIAAELGISFYDKEILKLVSSESGIKESYFHLADEKTANSILKKIVDSLLPSLSATIKGNNPLDEENLFKFQSDVIKKLAEKESCVIAGRLADYILRERDDVFSVYVHADLKVRIERISRLYALDEEESKRIINKRDRERSEYCRHYTKKDWGLADNYNLCLDSSRFGIDKCVKTVLFAIK